MQRKTATMILAAAGGLFGGLGALALVLGAAGALAGPSPSALQAPGAIPACAGCNVVLVSKDPAAAEYTTVEEALAYIATQTHDADHPWLVYVAPGVYELEAPLQMLEYVHIQGTGFGAVSSFTTLTRGGSNTTPLSVGDSATVLSDGSSATVLGAANSELSFLEIRNTGGGDYATGIRHDGGLTGPLRLNHVIVSAGGANIAFGIITQGSSLFITDSFISANGSSLSYGVYGAASVVLALRSSIGGIGAGGSFGIYQLGASANIVDGSLIGGDTNPIFSEGTSSVSFSGLEGGPIGGPGTATCVAVYDDSDVFYAGTCPP